VHIIIVSVDSNLNFKQRLGREVGVHSTKVDNNYEDEHGSLFILCFLLEARTSTFDFSSIT